AEDLFVFAEVNGQLGFILWRVPHDARFVCAAASEATGNEWDDLPRPIEMDLTHALLQVRCGNPVPVDEDPEHVPRADPIGGESVCARIYLADIRVDIW